MTGSSHTLRSGAPGRDLQSWSRPGSGLLPSCPPPSPSKSLGLQQGRPAGAAGAWLPGWQRRPLCQVPVMPASRGPSGPGSHRGRWRPRSPLILCLRALVLRPRWHRGCRRGRERALGFSARWTVTLTVPPGVPGVSDTSSPGWEHQGAGPGDGLVVIPSAGPWDSRSQTGTSRACGWGLGPPRPVDASGRGTG